MTELIWDGKYDQNGKKTAPLRISLPFQTVETVNESTIERQRMLDLFSAGRDPDWRNRLIWGDKKYVLPSLLDEFAGKVNLIYIDPPFNVGADFSFTAALPPSPPGRPPDGGRGDGGEGEDDSAAFTKEPSAIELKAYRDTWGRGLDSYLQWFYETAVLLRELLAENGSLYVHLDWHVGHYAKAVLDEVFRLENFRNEITWKRSSAHSDSNTCGNAHDVIFLYTKGADFIWNSQFQRYDEEYIQTHYGKVDDRGRRFGDFDLTAKGLQGGGYWYEWKGIYDNWRCPLETMLEYEKQGRLYYTKAGRPRYKRYLDEMPGMPLQDIWTDIPPVNSQAAERLGYDTQKPEALLERILKASSNEGDLALDCFCGSGTTPAVAEKLGRRWIACDLSRFAIHVTRKRLLGIPGVRPFVVQNLGKYERQVWQSSVFSGQSSVDGGQSSGMSEAERVTQAYRKFILDLYHARPIQGYLWLHGVKGGRMVHVGSVDAPVTAGDLAALAAEFKKAVGTGKDAPATNGVDVLGWDFAFELNEVAKQQAAQANLDVRFFRIPRDVMDKRAVEQGDIHFFELGALKVETQVKGREVALTLSDFVIPLDDVPQEVQQSIKHWSQWVDYWAVDWDYKGDAFHNQWQTYRTRKKPKLELSASHVYGSPGEYTIVVKVIDILGNDTTKTLKVKVG